MFNHSKRSARVASAAAILLAGSLTAVGVSGAANAAPRSPSAHGGAKPTVVLVNGAWADGGSFGTIGPRLRHDGYTVVNFNNPLRSLSGDAADLNSFLKVKTSGPVVLVGHSYGGAVITEAATSDSSVKALVYVDAFAPDNGESVLGLEGSPSASSAAAEFDEVPYAGAPSGDVNLYLKPKAFAASLANGLPKAEQQELFARQNPVTLSALNDKATTPAWKTLPSWYVEGTQDHSIPLPLQEKMAKRAHSHVTKVKAGHLSMLKAPSAIIRVIQRAAAATR
jgi:pimeloyl-ACP methyl ester carboxylesterase